MLSAWAPGVLAFARAASPVSFAAVAFFSASSVRAAPVFNCACCSFTNVSSWSGGPARFQLGAVVSWGHQGSALRSLFIGREAVGPHLVEVRHHALRTVRKVAYVEAFEVKALAIADVGRAGRNDLAGRQCREIGPAHSGKAENAEAKSHGCSLPSKLAASGSDYTTGLRPFGRF